jgi:hypothetical protein
MDITQKLRKFVDVFSDTEKVIEIAKSYVSRYPTSGYFAIEGSNILSLGWELPIDATMEDTEFSGRYALLIAKTGENSWTPNISAKILDKDLSNVDANADALSLTESNKNSVENVIICIGINRKFANRPIFQALSQYTQVSKSDDYVIDLQKVYNNVDELPSAVKKLSSKKQRQWLAVWNSSYKENKDEKRAFASAWSVVEKADTDAEQSGEICPVCKKIASECTCEDMKKNVNISFDIPLKKSSMVDGLVYGIVYEPMKKDTQGDWTSAEEIERAAHSFLPSALRLKKSADPCFDVNHEDPLSVGDVEIVESYIAPCDFTLPTNEKVIKGSWVVVSRINSAELKQDIEDEKLTGYSLEGKARRLDMEFTGV